MSVPPNLIKETNKYRANRQPQFGKFWVNAVVVAILALAVIFVASPLFSSLGFEYSALMGMALSFFCGVKASLQQDKTEPGVFGALTEELRDAVILAVIPLALSAISLFWQPNCAFGDGVLLYVEVALPSAVLGGMFGLVSSVISPRGRISLLLFAGFWIVTLVLSLLPGYTNPQLFTYGWQYGFFPGFVWDEALTLKLPYLISRVEVFVWAALAMAVVARVSKEGSKKATVLLVVLVIFSIACYVTSDWFGITASTTEVRKSLSKEIGVDSNVYIEFAPKSLTSEQITQTRNDVLWYLHDIRSRFKLTERLPVHIFIYPNIESLNRFIGTRSASIAKPWLGQVHIAAGNLTSLKHELTHILLKEKASFPFYASWSTGLTEGAAMSVEPRYDGLFTLDQHAARILQMHFASGVSEVMAFTGFAANASAKSYVLAGSFCGYLLRTYGSARFDRLYSSLDYESNYGKSFDKLEADWLASLAQYETPLSRSDSARLRYYYDRSSIVFQGCARRIGKLERLASESFDAHDYRMAEQQYRQAVAEGGGIGALSGEADAMIQQQRLEQALKLLDTTQVSDVIKQKPALEIEQADLRYLLGDTSGAAREYQDAESVKLSASAFLTAYSHRSLMESDVGDIYRQYLQTAYLADTTLTATLDSILAKLQSAHRETEASDIPALLLDYYRTIYFERRGELAKALRFDPFGSGTAYNPITTNDSLAIYLMATHLRILRVSGSGCENLCPKAYLPAAERLENELRAKENWLRLHQELPYHETYQ